MLLKEPYRDLEIRLSYHEKRKEPANTILAKMALIDPEGYEKFLNTLPGTSRTIWHRSTIDGALELLEKQEL